MLVLSRQIDESIMIGDDVKITIVDVRGDKVRLGIEAPKHIPVHRMEIYEAIQREKKEKQAQEQPEKESQQPEKAVQKEPKKEPKKEPQQQPEKVAQEEPARAPHKQHK